MNANEPKREEIGDEPIEKFKEDLVAFYQNFSELNIQYMRNAKQVKEQRVNLMNAADVYHTHLLSFIGECRWRCLALVRVSEDEKSLRRCLTVRLE